MHSKTPIFWSSTLITCKAGLKASIDSKAENMVRRKTAHLHYLRFKSAHPYWPNIFNFSSPQYQIKSHVSLFEFQKFQGILPCWHLSKFVVCVLNLICSALRVIVLTEVEPIALWVRQSRAHCVTGTALRRMPCSRGSLQCCSSLCSSQNDRCQTDLVGTAVSVSTSRRWNQVDWARATGQGFFNPNLRPSANLCVTSTKLWVLNLWFLVGREIVSLLPKEDRKPGILYVQTT